MQKIKDKWNVIVDLIADTYKMIDGYAKLHNVQYNHNKRLRLVVYTVSKKLDIQEDELTTYLALKLLEAIDRDKDKPSLIEISKDMYMPIKELLE